MNGNVRVNNNSGIVIDSNRMAEMTKSIANDRSFAFDGAFMLIKTHQSFQGTTATDYKLVGPDGTVYSFDSYFCTQCRNIIGIVKNFKKSIVF